MKPNRHAISERDRPGFIEEQDVDIPGCLDGAPAHGQHIALKNAIHSGDTNRAKQSADRCRDQTNQQSYENWNRKRRARINAKRFECDAYEEKNERQRGQKNRERYFVRRFLTARAFD
jgi:hypothetical protein